MQTNKIVANVRMGHDVHLRVDHTASSREADLGVEKGGRQFMTYILTSKGAKGGPFAPLLDPPLQCMCTTSSIVVLSSWMLEYSNSSEIAPKYIVTAVSIQEITYGICV